MRKRYDEGGEVDAMEAANKSDEAMDIASSVGAGERNTETVKAAPKPAAKPKAAAKPVAKSAKPATKAEPAPKAASTDVTKMSLAERAKASRDKARTGSGTTDTRSVSQRLRSAFGMKNGGMTASKRADGIASRGKTNCKMY
jgi:hypothetical protein